MKGKVSVLMKGGGGRYQFDEREGISSDEGEGEGYQSDEDEGGRYQS